MIAVLCWITFKKKKKKRTISFIKFDPRFEKKNIFLTFVMSVIFIANTELKEDNSLPPLTNLNFISYCVTFIISRCCRRYARLGTNTLFAGEKAMCILDPRSWPRGRKDPTSLILCRHSLTGKGRPTFQTPQDSCQKARTIMTVWPSPLLTWGRKIPRLSEEKLARRQTVGFWRFLIINTETTRMWTLTSWISTENCSTQSIYHSPIFVEVELKLCWLNQSTTTWEINI